MRSRILARVLVSAGIAAVAGAACSSSSGDPGDVIPGGDVLPDTEPLKAYGIQTNLGAPKGADGVELPEGYHPMGRAISYLYPLREVMVAGVKYHGADEDRKERRALLLQDAAAGDKVAWAGSETAESWVESPLAMIPGDVDADGLQEVVVLRFTRDGGGSMEEKGNPGTASISILDRTTGSKYEMGTPTVLDGKFDVTTRDGAEDARYLMDVAAADLDGDGADEVAAVIGNTLVFLDDRNHDFAMIGEPVDFRKGDRNETTKTLHVTRIDAADFDGDGADEIVVIDGVDDSATCDWYLFGGVPAVQIAKGAVSNGTKSMQYGNVAVGDIDGDRQPEAVFVGDDPKGSGDTRWMLAAEWNGTTLEFLPAFYQVSADWSSHRVVALGVFNPDGIEAKAASSIAVHQDVVAYDAEKREFTKRYSYQRDGFARDLVVTGDVLGNRRQQVVVQESGDLDVWGLDDGGNWKKVATWDIDRDKGAYTALAVPEIDGDSVSVQYVGRHELRFSDPEVVALLASPPYWKDIQEGQGVLGNCGTTFSRSSGSGTEKTNAFSVKAEFSIGVSVEAPLFGKTAGSLEVKHTFSAHFDYRTAKSQSTEVEQGYGCPPGENQVIVSAVPFDVYYYRIRTSPVAADVDKEIPVSIPREPQIVPFEVDAFDQVNDGRVPYDRKVLGHTLGDPRSYPRKADMQVLIDQSGGDFLWDPTGLTVGLSNGLTWDTVTQEQSQGTTYGFGVGYSYSVEAVTGGALFGASLGFEYGYEATVSTSEGTSISGVVPNLPPGTDLATWQYTYGIAAYKPEGTYFVVTYWVD